MNALEQKGFTLVELLVSVVIGLATLTAITVLFVSTLSSHNDTVHLTRLEEDLSATMDIMVRDLRRAGYFPAAAMRLAARQSDDLEGDFDNPFGDVTVTDSDGTDDCILYSYDLPTVTNSVTVSTTTITVTPKPAERAGFRLGSNALERRKSAASDTDCSDGTWEQLTDPAEVKITGLTFDLDVATASPIAGVVSEINIRTVKIQLTGEWANDAALTRSIEETVRIRAEELVE